MMNRSFTLTITLFLLSLGKLQAAITQGESGETLFAITSLNNLISFKSTAPGVVLGTTPIYGLQPGETIVGMDFRPANGQLYAVGSANRIYVINPVTGAATQAGAASAFSPGLVGGAFGVDFNPVVDRIRVVSDADQNLRLNQTNGMVVDFDTNAGGIQPDTALSYVQGDSNFGQDPNVVAVAYTNNFAGTTSTTLYGIDSSRDALVRQGGVNGSPSPNLGALSTVGSLGVDTSDLVGFDISSGGATAFASLTVAGEAASKLYSINLANGSATSLGNIGSGELVRGIAAAPRVTTIFGITPSNNLLRFSSSSPSTVISTTQVSGLQPGESIVGIDFRPATRQLYGVGSSNRIYVINAVTGLATQAGSGAAFNPGLNGTNFGVDFNPTVDRIRVVSDAGQNLRLNQTNGAVVDFDPNTNGIQTDNPLAYAQGDANFGQDPRVVGVAYTNNFAGGTSTTLYGIDSSLNALVRQGGPGGSPSPNLGALTTVGSLGVDVSDVVGFDIVGFDSAGFAAFSVAGETVSRLYRVDLNTGYHRPGRYARWVGKHS